MNRLWVRLGISFATIVLVAGGILTLTGLLLTQGGVARWIATTSLQAPGGLVDRLVTYYNDQNSWNGIEAALPDSIKSSVPPNGDVSITDANGRILATVKHVDPPKPEMSTQSVPIVTDGQTRGYMLLTLPRPFNEDFYLRRVGTSILFAAVFTGIFGLVAAFFVSRGLTAPVNRLAAAAKAVGRHDLDVRVQASGSREMIDLANAFNEMAADLQRGETLRREMLADTAHELRTPLSVLSANLRAMLDDVYPMDKAEVARLYEQVRLLSRLVNDLHELAQAEARQLHLDFFPIDVSELVEDLMQVYLPVAEADDIRLTSTVPRDLSPVSADPSRLAQVLHNLLGNALRHTPPGGTIHISVTQTPANTRIAVSDTGEGIPAEHLPHIFDRFYRVDRTRARETGGSGLGLAIAKAIVEAHNGTIGASSSPEKGSTFTITLPQGQAVEMRQPAPALA